MIDRFDSSDLQIQCLGQLLFYKEQKKNRIWATEVVTVSIVKATETVSAMVDSCISSFSE
jgi:hypothetical protein